MRHYPTSATTRYCIGNGEEAYGVSQISRKIQIGKEVFETEYPDDLYSKNLIGFTSERYMSKIAIDFIEFGVNNYVNKEDFEKLTQQVSLIKSIFNNETSINSLKDSIPYKYNKMHIECAIDNFIILNSEFKLDRKQVAIISIMYNLSNQADPIYDQSQKRIEEHLRQGEHIISSLKSGECMFYL